METIELTNGLRVIMVSKPNHHSIIANLYIKAGSRLEKKDQLGLFHFLEHLVFDGTKEFPRNMELGRAIESIGGQFNGSTNPNYINFFCHVPAKYLNLAISALGQWTLYPLIRKKDIEKERSIIIEEIKMYQDRPESWAEMNLDKMMSENKNIVRWPIGEIGTVKRLTKDDIIKHHQKYFQPNQMVLVLGGSFPKDQALRLIKKEFSIIGTSRLPKDDFKPSQQS